MFFPCHRVRWLDPLVHETDGLLVRFVRCLSRHDVVLDIGPVHPTLMTWSTRQRELRMSERICISPLSEGRGPRDVFLSPDPVRRLGRLTHETYGPLYEPVPDLS